MVYLSNDKHMTKVHKIFMGYVKVVSFVGGVKPVMSLFQKRFSLDVENSAIQLKIQEISLILFEYHQTMSTSLIQRWVHRVLQKSPPYWTDILKWEQAFM